MNRSDLTDQFKVSVNKASTGQSHCIGSALDQIACEDSALTDVRSSQFERQFPETNANRHVSQLRSVADGILDREASRNANLPPHASAPTPVRGMHRVTLLTPILRSETNSAPCWPGRLEAGRPAYRASKRRGRP